MRENKSYRFANLLSFIDLLFNLMLGSLAMFLLSLQMMAPTVKKVTEDVPRSAEFVIRIEWAGNSDHDVDVWAKNSTGEICGFLTKEPPTMHLERDNRGIDSDRLEPKHINEEIISIQKGVPGWYVVNLHWYTARTDPKNPEVKWSLIKMKPSMQTVISGTVILDKKGQEKTAVRFLINEKNEVISTDTIIQTPYVVKGAAAAAIPPIPSGDK